MNIRVKKAVDRMAAQRITSEELLGQIPMDPPAWLLEEEQSADPVVPTPRPRAVTRRRILAAAGLTAMAAGAAAAIPQLFRTNAATPPLLTYAPRSAGKDPATLLTDLADRARRAPQPPGTGPYNYIQTRSWYLDTSTDTHGKVFSARISETDREQWMAQDGSGRIEEFRDGQPSPINGLQRPGRYALPFLTANTVEEARAALTRKYHGPTAAWFDAAREVWSLQVVTPQIQSALLAILATQPGLASEGTTTDRAGRQGVAISTTYRGPQAPAPAVRYVLVIDPGTGMVLSYEAVALEAGKLPIQVPSTIGYALFLRAGYTADTTNRP